MSFKVKEVIDGDTFDVTPGWKWDGKNGDRVRIANLDAAELHQPGGQAAKTKLKNLVEGKAVELKNAVNMSYGRIVCDVHYNGKDIKTML
ncbi:MAG: thermonuclease family protein [Bacteroidales bacterium]|nr:thermonuclease family protein [Bacteroidales bacterium]